MIAFELIATKVLSMGCGATDGGKFDFTEACTTCGTGARRIDPITLPKDRLGRRILATERNEIVIPPRLVEKIRVIAPECLREIHDSRTRELLDHCELIPEVTLPRWDSHTSGWCISQMDKPCSACRRDGYFNIPNVPLQLVYSGDLPVFRVAKTYECLGKSFVRPKFSDSWFAKSPFVVTDEIKNMLADEPGVEFIPVIFNQPREGHGSTIHKTL